MFAVAWSGMACSLYDAAFATLGGLYGQEARKAITHLERVHPGAVEQLRSGRTFVHPGIGDQEGL